MIKKYKEFIFEDEDNGDETSSASATTTSFKSRFEKFKEFLAKKSSGSGSSHRDISYRWICSKILYSGIRGF
jgi:hypothetical protein